MKQTTVGQLLINQGLPEDLQDYNRRLDKKSIRKLMSEVAEKYPDRYPEILKHLMDVSRSFASTGGVSVSLKHLLESPAARQMLDKLREENDQDVQDSELPPDKLEKRIVARTAAIYDKLKDAVSAEGLAAGSPYAQQAVSGSRGSVQQLSSLVGADLLVSDHRNEVIPVPIYNSYSHGLDPVEYWAAGYGTRKGMVDVKFATGDAGYLGKQLSLAVQRQTVTNERPTQRRLPVGLPVDLDDPDNEGSVLAVETAGYPAGTTLTPRVLEDVRRRHKSDRILVHSPLTALTEDGGIDQWSAGMRDKGRLSDIGDNVGIASAQAVSEPVSQGLLNCLAAGTLVRMADFSTRPIERLCAGDMVLGADRSGRTFPVRVSRTYDQGLQPCVSYTFRPYGSSEVRELVCTPEHKVLLRQPGQDWGIEPIGSGIGCFEVHCGASHVPFGGACQAGQLQTHDIEVDHPDHLFSLANGMIVSNSKHSAGVGGSRASRGGFQYLNNLLQGPETFEQAGPLAPEGGTISDIQDAPQGGKFVTIGQTRVYVRPGLELEVKLGQEVDVGDDLTDGVPHPKDLVRYRGIGEARRTYLQNFVEALRNSDIPIHRRNAESIVAGVINHARVTDPDGYNDHLIDQVVPYNQLAANYQARQTAQRLTPAKSRGKYLEEPALHYTPGTRLTRRMIKELQDFGVQDLDVHDDPPSFEPQFERLLTGSSYDPDWQTRLGGFYIGRSFLKSVHEGAESDPQSTSPLPAIAQGTTLGQNIGRTGRY